ncbi:Centrosomal protein of 192 kDa [Plecturocebus cupreus]
MTNVCIRGKESARKDVLVKTLRAPDVKLNSDNFHDANANGGFDPNDPVKQGAECPHQNKTVLHMDGCLNTETPKVSIQENMDVASLKPISDSGINFADAVWSPASERRTCECYESIEKNKDKRDLPQSVVYQNEEGRWVTDLAYYTSFNSKQNLNIFLSDEMNEDFRSGSQQCTPAEPAAGQWLHMDGQFHVAGEASASWQEAKATSYVAVAREKMRKKQKRKLLINPSDPVRLIYYLENSMGKTDPHVSVTSPWVPPTTRYECGTQSRIPKEQCGSDWSLMDTIRDTEAFDLIAQDEEEFNKEHQFIQVAEITGKHYLFKNFLKNFFDGVSNCCLNWSAVARSWLTAASVSHFQVILLASASQVAGIAGTHHHAWLIFLIFLAEMGLGNSEIPSKKKKKKERKREREREREEEAAEGDIKKKLYFFLCRRLLPYVRCPDRESQQKTEEGKKQAEA